MVICQTSKCLALDLDFCVAGLLCWILNVQNPHIQLLVFSYQQVLNTLEIDYSFFLSQMRLHFQANTKCTKQLKIRHQIIWGVGVVSEIHTKKTKKNKHLHNFLNTFAAGRYSVFNLDTITRHQNL